MAHLLSEKAGQDQLEFSLESLDNFLESNVHCVCQHVLSLWGGKRLVRKKLMTSIFTCKENAVICRSDLRK